jgi:hypothetical protein
LAGIIDGEGTIGIYYSKKQNIYRLKIYVVNTNKELITWIQDTFGGYVYSRESNKGWKTRYEWHCKDISDDILKKVFPYLIVKKQQAKIAIAFRKTHQHHGHNLSPKLKELRKSLWVEVKKLNTRGSGMSVKG